MKTFRPLLKFSMVMLGGMLAFSNLAEAKKGQSSGCNCCHLGSWTPVANQPKLVAFGYPPGTDFPTPGGFAYPLLLTDGSVLAFNYGFNFDTSEVWRLTPDINGSYVNGKWKQVASLPNNYSPNAMSTVVLPDGRVIIQGGESNGPNEHFALSNVGYIYDPVADTWTSLPPPPFFQAMYPSRRLFAPRDIGDSCGICLADGSYVVFTKLSGQMAKLDAKTLTWTELGTSTYVDWFNEQNLTLLPNGKVLTVKCYNGAGFLPNLYPYPADPTAALLYDPETDEWTSAGSSIYPMSEQSGGEIGGAILRPDGLVAQFSGTPTGLNSIYDYKKNSWSPIRPLPVIDGKQQTNADGNSILLPNGNILLQTDPFLFELPIHFLEFTYDTMEFVQQPDLPNSPNDFGVGFVMLPTGQVLTLDYTVNAQIYTPGNNNYKPEWAPVVKKAPKNVSPGGSYKISGIRFNGMSQCGQTGDDSSQATNYPLLRITNNKSGHVFYCRTHDHSSMAVASDKKVYTFFDVPADIELGKSKLEVVANGIPSKPVSIVVE